MEALTDEALHRELTSALAEIAVLREALVDIAAEISIPVPTGKNGVNFKKLYKLWRKQATQRCDIARAAIRKDQTND